MLGIRKKYKSGNGVKDTEGEVREKSRQDIPSKLL
jgi:hypothetical protein